MNKTREEAIKLEKGKANKLIKKSKKEKEKGKPVLIKSIGKEKTKGRPSSQGRSDGFLKEKEELRRQQCAGVWGLTLLTSVCALSS